MAIKNDPFHFPLMQIIRWPEGGNGTALVIFSNNWIMEPKPTGYLNVYEYDLTTEQYQVQPGDILQIFGNSSSVVYQSPLSSSEVFPLVSIVVGNCDIYLLNLSTVYCSDTTRLSTSNTETSLSTSTATEERGTKTSNQSVIISITGGIVSCIILSSLLIILLIIVAIMIRRRRKLASTLFTTTESSRTAIDQGGTAALVSRNHYYVLHCR